MDCCMDFSDDCRNLYKHTPRTIILWKQMGPIQALWTAVGMSLISMILMELAMNLTDFAIMGEPAITWSVLPFTLGAGFLAAWPYNYWKLKKYGKCCH